MNALINVVLPVFGIILTGYLAGYYGVLGPDSAAALNRFVFYFALPPALFIFVARAPIDKIFNWPFIGVIVIGLILTLLIALVAGRVWFQHDLPTLTVIGLAAVWGNGVYIGLPLLLTAYGPDAALPPIIVAVIQLLLFLSTAIAILEARRTSGSVQVASQLFSTLLRNPLVIAPLLGILVSTTQFHLPKALTNYLDLMAAAVGPAALFSIGLSLVGRKLIGNLMEVIMAGNAQGFYQSNSNTHTGGIFLYPGAIMVKGSGYSLCNARGGEPLRDRPTIRPACRDCVVSFHCLYSNVGGHDFLPSDLARTY